MNNAATPEKRGRETRFSKPNRDVRDDPTTSDTINRYLSGLIAAPPMLQSTANVMDAEDGRMTSPIGMMSKSEVMRYVAAASDGHGFVDARKLVVELGALVFPANLNEAVSAAFAAARNGWQKTWPTPVSVSSEVVAEEDGVSFLQVTVMVQSRSKAERVRYRSSMETIVRDALSDAGVARGKKFDYQTYIVIDE